MGLIGENIQSLPFCHACIPAWARHRDPPYPTDTMDSAQPRAATDTRGSCPTSPYTRGAQQCSEGMQWHSSASSKVEPKSVPKREPEVGGSALGLYWSQQTLAEILASLQSCKAVGGDNGRTEDFILFFASLLSWLRQCFSGKAATRPTEKILINKLAKPSIPELKGMRSPQCLTVLSST